MCGISGAVDFEGGERGELLERIASKICISQAHRGPDAWGLWSSSEGSCALGHRRLAIVDLDVRSDQPMVTLDGRYAITFNGEIYNYRTLRRELEASGRIFKTRSDTEVILLGYSHWGVRLFERLDGMFAIAIFDTITHELVLARDRIGEKPLYYSRVDNILIFSSELKALLRTGRVSRKITQRGIFDYLALRYVPDPATIFEEIFSVQPGTFLHFDNEGRAQEKVYYAFDIKPSFEGNADDYLDALEYTLTSAVQARLAADVSVAALLSSGIDSSLVCALAARETNRGIVCFSAGFVGSADDETRHARLIAQFLGLSFESICITGADLLTCTNNFGEIMDEPNGDRSCLPTYVLSKLVGSRAKVALSGDGGDELFAGYGRYLTNGQDISNHVMSVAEHVSNYFSKSLKVFDWEALQSAMPNEFHSFRRRFLSRFFSTFARSELSTIDQLRTTDLYSYLPGAVLAKVDRMSMRHSLEIRTPFFSPEVLALSSQLPSELAESNGLLKISLRRILARYLPAQLILRGKQGFGTPTSVFTNNIEVFKKLALDADEVLQNWYPIVDFPVAFSILKSAARQNINSLWAWIALGQWVKSIYSIADGSDLRELYGHKYATV